MTLKLSTWLPRIFSTTAGVSRWFLSRIVSLVTGSTNSVRTARPTNSAAMRGISLTPAARRRAIRALVSFAPSDQRLLASLLRDLTGTFEAMMNLRIQFAKELTLDHPDLFDGVIYLEQVIAGIAKGFQQNRSRHLPASID